MLPTDLKNRDLKKKNWFGDKLAINFQILAYFCSLEKGYVVSQILNICNYEVLLIKKWSLANITRVRKITVFYDLFHHVFFFLFFFFFFFFFCNHRSEKFHLV